MMISYPDRFHCHSVWPGVTCSHPWPCLLTINNMLSEKKEFTASYSDAGNRKLSACCLLSLAFYSHV